MKAALFAIALLFAAPALACDNYISASVEGRSLTDNISELVVRDANGEETIYITTSAGTGTGIRIAVPEDGGEALEYVREGQSFQLGTERFRCK